jgi:hypothetical protein
MTGIAMYREFVSMKSAINSEKACRLVVYLNGVYSWGYVSGSLPLPGEVKLPVQGLAHY